MLRGARSSLSARCPTNSGWRYVFSNSVQGRELPKATIPGGSNKQPMMRLGITRPGCGCESLLGHHEQISQFASRDSLFVGRNFPVPEFRETSRVGPRNALGLENLASARGRLWANSLYFPCRSGISSQRRFAIDCPHRHSVRVSEESGLGSPAAAKTPATSRALGRGPRRANTGET